MTPHPSAAAHLPLDPATTDETLATIFAAQRHDPGSTPAQLQSLREAGAAFIGELRPRDPVEAANAARAVAAHYGAMECFRRAMLPDTPDNAALRWSGRAMALSRMNTELVRTLRQCQAATPRAQPQPQPQPAARPAMPPPPAVAAVARQAAAIAAKPAGRQDPMSSERASFTPAACILTTQPAATSILSAPPPRQSLRAELLGSTADVAAMLAAATVQAAKPAATQACPRALDPRDPMSSERRSPAPTASAVTSRPVPAAPVLSATPLRQGSGAGLGSTSLADGRLAAAPA